MIYVYYVNDTDFMTESYLVRKEDAASKYYKKIKEILQLDNTQINCREFIKKCE